MFDGPPTFRSCLKGQRSTLYFIRLRLERVKDMGITYTEDQKALIAAARSGDDAAIQAFVDRGFDIDCELKYSASALMIAASRGKTSTVRLLVANGAKVNRRNKFGGSPLLEACERCHHDTIRALVELGADVNMPHNNGNTALLAAAMRRDIKTVRVLLELGADREVQNFDGWSGRTWAEAESDPALREVFGLPKSKEPRLAEVQLKEGEQPKKATKVMVNDAFWTVFMRAASIGDLETVRRLADDGVEVNGQSPNGTTALMAAVKNGHAATALELIELGADPTIEDEEGLNAVEWAEKKGQEAFIKGLKQKGIPLPEFDS